MYVTCFFKVLIQLGIVTHALESPYCGVEAGILGVQGHSWLQNKFKSAAYIGYCFKTNKNKKAS